MQIKIYLIKGQLVTSDKEVIDKLGLSNLYEIIIQNQEKLVQSHLIVEVNHSLNNSFFITEQGCREIFRLIKNYPMVDFFYPGCFMDWFS